MRFLLELFVAFRRPLWRIGDLREGLHVIVRGVVVPRDLIESPVTGERCVYYRHVVEEWRRPTAGLGVPGFWHPVERDEAIAEFYLQDPSGRAIVLPQGARVDPGRRPSNEIELADDRRARELVIRAGDRLEITAVPVPVDDLYDDARDYRGDTRRWALQMPHIRVVI